MTDFEIVILVLVISLGAYILWTELTKTNHNH